MSARKTILQGTLILTAVGFLCRFMGFFYRIFLSHTFGEENVGLYQLTFPVFALCISFTSAGLETAISRTVARKQSLHQPREASETLCLGLFISCLLSVITMIILQKNAADLSTALLGDPRCEEILILLSYALPLSAIHGCIMGYCYGLKQTQIPAVSQLIEQTARILSVFCLYRFAIRNGLHADISIAAAGIAFGELFSTFYSVRGLQKSRSDIFRPGFSFSSIRLRFRELVPLSLPLTANRVLLGLLQGIEAVSIPGCLKLYNHSTSLYSIPVRHHQFCFYHADADSCRASGQRPGIRHQKTAAKSTWLLFSHGIVLLSVFPVLRTVDRSIFVCQ